MKSSPSATIEHARWLRSDETCPKRVSRPDGFAIVVALSVGQCDDPHRQPQLSHLVEHLVMRECVDRLLGRTSQGLYCNAELDLDHMCFFFAGTMPLMTFARDAAATLLEEFQLSEHAFREEKHLVLEEVLQRNAFSSEVERTLLLEFGSSNAGIRERRLRKLISKLTRADVFRARTDWFTSRDISVAIAMEKNGNCCAEVHPRSRTKSHVNSGATSRPNLSSPGFRSARAMLWNITWHHFAMCSINCSQEMRVAAMMLSSYFMLCFRAGIWQASRRTQQPYQITSRDRHLLTRTIVEIEMATPPAQSRMAIQSVKSLCEAIHKQGVENIDELRSCILVRLSVHFASVVRIAHFLAREGLRDRECAFKSVDSLIDCVQTMSAECAIEQMMQLANPAAIKLTRVGPHWSSTCPGWR